MKTQHYLTALFLLFTSLLYASHNRSGEIIFKKTGSLSVEATIITYTRASSVNADRDSLDINWGDGTIERIVRVNGNGAGEVIGTDLKKNFYTSTHTYVQEGEYLISTTDPNRTANIINVNPPSSDNVPFHLEARLRLLPGAATSLNSPIFLELPVDQAYAFVPFSHVVNAFDPDGDSLAFELVVPMAGLNTDVPNYAFPDQVSPSSDNKIFLDPVTGEFFWDAPISPGVYCIAILVKAYRNGILMETTRRDMSIEVAFQTNYPPIIVITPDIDSLVDISVGDLVEITVNATDPDPGQLLTITATGGPFEDFFQEKASFSVTDSSGVFSWRITPEYLRTAPYQIVFKAKDDLFGYGLATNKIVRFRVREQVKQYEPFVETLNITPNPASGEINIQWPDLLTEVATLQLFDFTGKLQRKEPLAIGSNNKSLDLNGLQPGLYFLDIQTVAGKKFGGKLLKI